MKNQTFSCCVTGKVLPEDKMIHFILSPQGDVLVDVDHSFKNQGFWMSSSGDVIRRACCENIFEALFDQSIHIQDDFVDHIVDLLKRRCLNLLSLARRCGDVLSGFEKVKSSLIQGKKSPAFVLFAQDGSRHAKEKIFSLCRQKQIDIMSYLTAQELGGVFSKQRVVYACVLKGGLAHQLKNDMNRLEGMGDRCH